MGHHYLFQKFPGETEANVNLLHVAVWNQAFGYDLDVAFEKSRHYNNPFRTLDTTSISWMMTQNFKLERPMEAEEKRYQLKGHAKFVEIAKTFGWDVLGDYWKSFNDDYEDGNLISTDIDSLLLRLSKNVGVDIAPLFHFWGVPPDNVSALKAAIEAEGLPKSPEIYDTLLRYKSLVPADNAAYQSFARSWWEGPPSSDGHMTQQDHAAIWDTYDEAYASLIETNVQNILDLYFPDGYPRSLLGDLNLDGVVDELDWPLFLAGNQMDLSGMSRHEAYLMGDLDSDLDNDAYDFHLFRTAFEEANPAPGAFEAMVARAVPEPSSIMLLAAGAVGLGIRRRRRARQVHPPQ